jgi:hypothetical protein
VSTGVLSAAMGCLLEGVENDYRLISGYFGGIAFEGLQEAHPFDIQLKPVFFLSS